MMATSKPSNGKPLLPTTPASLPPKDAHAADEKQDSRAIVPKSDSEPKPGTYFLYIGLGLTTVLFYITLFGSWWLEIVGRARRRHDGTQSNHAIDPELQVKHREQQPFLRRRCLLRCFRDVSHSTPLPDVASSLKLVYSSKSLKV
jgi:hypothetical protein